MSVTIIFLFYIFTYTVISLGQEWNEIQKELTREEKNALCCAQKSTCCKKTPQPTKFEVRAVLLKCPPFLPTHNESCSNDGPSVSATGLFRKRHVKGSKYSRSVNEDFQILNCKKKMKLTIKIKNSGMTNCKNQYILIDHVYDEQSGQKQKLLYPYALKIKQQPIMQIYGLDYESMVNAQAKEKVYSKQDAGYTGCNTNPASPKPTCGSVKYNNKVIPYSTGFCCSCGNKDGIMEKFIDTNNFSSYRVPLAEEGFNRNNRNYIPDVFNNHGNNEFSDGFSSVRHASSDINIHDEGSIHALNKKQLFERGPKRFIHKRGGQDCSDPTIPPNVDAKTYHDSTHCLEFSNIWYSVYDLNKPKLFHFFQMQIFEKFLDGDNTCKWKDFTKRIPIYMGSEIKHYINEESTIAMNYKAKDTPFALNYKIHKLLIPDTSTVKDIDFHPELKGGPEEYLVVRDSEVQSNGQVCDVAGVGYEAFANQPKRCSSPKGSCLKNQPVHMWQQDKDAERNGMLGKYFLKYYGQLPQIPISGNATDHNRTLTMYYTECFTSLLDVELKADHNLLLKPNIYAVLTEVYIDATSSTKTSITAKVFNSGLVSSVFKVSLTKCPVEVPASFSNINTKPALIAPQRQHIFNIQIQGTIPLTEFHCTMQVTNEKEEVIVSRKIRYHKQDRCICIWYCICGCFETDGGLKCKPFSLEEYYAAGFQGGLPVPSHIIRHTFLDDMISLMLHVFLFLIITLLVMGFCKAFIGCFSVPIGRWGLNMYLDLPKKLKKYYESDIADRDVVYDDDGWPIHPDTGEKVRNVFVAAEFCINVVFFLLYPFAFVWMSLKRIFCQPVSSENSKETFSSCKCRDGSMVQKRSSSVQLSLNRRSISMGG